jgi:hypothetical protein
MPHYLNKAKQCVGEYKVSTGNPGCLTIQYKINGKDIKDMIFPSYSGNEGWKLEKHSRENLLRLTPHTRNDRKLKIVFIIRKKFPNGGIKLKAVLEDRESGLFSLITSMNEEFSKKYEGRTLKVTDSSWRICWTNMSAPAMFWEEFQNRLLY